MPSHSSQRKILFLAANPKDTSRLRLDEEIRNIQEGLKLAAGRTTFELISQWAVRTKDLRRALLEYEPQVVHFSGHGAGDPGLILEDDQGNAQAMSATVLTHLFKLCPSVDCVVLNACYSEMQARAIASHIPYVIGMNQAIGDTTAIKFVVGFYDALGYGRSYTEAYEFGMTAIGIDPVIVQRDISLASDDQDIDQPDPVSPILIQSQPRPQRPTAHTLSKQGYRDRQALLNKVKTYWIKGVLERSLHQQVLINLGVEERIDLADPFNIVLGMVENTQYTLPANKSVITIFDGLGPDSTLLILGEPGSGKTITLLQLTQELLERAEQHIDHPIPVVVNLSSWDGQQSIATWLVTELNSKYQVPKAIGQPWVDNRDLLLLLDGLDEVRADCREACVLAFNQFQQNHSISSIICSRIRDYEALSQRLTVQQAIYVKALTLMQIDQYLQQLNADLTGLQQLLKGDEALQELARSPLMLNILILAYEGRALEDVPQMNIDQHRQQIFNAYIQRMLKRRGHPGLFSPDQTVRWLSWLAQQLVQSSQTMFLIEGLDHIWLTTPSQRLLYSMLSSLMVGLSWGIIIACSIGHNQHWIVNGLAFCFLYSVVNFPLVWMFIRVTTLQSTPNSGSLKRLVGSLWTGVMTGFMFGSIVAVSVIPQSLDIADKFLPISITTILTVLIIGSLDWLLGGSLGFSFVRPIEALKWSWTNAKKYLVFTLIGVSPFALVQSMVSINILGGNLLQGLLLVMLGSVVVGLLISLRAGAGIETRHVPNQGIWRSLKTSLTTVLTLAIVFIPGLHFLRQWVEIVPGLELFFSLWLGLLMGGSACLVHLSFRLVFYGHGCMPWNYARFLDNAVKLAFLQKVGGGYIFIHRSLMEHFAQMKPDAKFPKRYH